jgi:single-stranded-DNA-specific exonuclease
LGFVIGPRLNAVGRLSNPTEALRLLCSQNSIQASKYAANLDKFNRDRQAIQKDNLKIAEDNNLENKNKLVFIAHKDFLPGIIGLIAGRLTEKYYLPSIIISIGDEYSKASCRSIKELNIIEALRKFDSDLVELGGHSGAAGFTIKTENIIKFQKKITNFINKKLKDIDLKPSIIVEAEMDLSAVNLKNCRLISQFEPFGIDNPKPLFLFKNLCISQKRILGSTGDHLKLKFNNIDAIAFKKGDLDKTLKIGDPVDLIASLDLNIWNGSTSPQLVVKEIFPV